MKVTREKFMKVVEVAEDLGCKVVYDSTKKLVLIQICI